MAESGVYVGGHIRRERPGTITKLKESGFTYVILFNINVESDGTLKTDGETVCSNGQYVFGNTQPYYISDIQSLKASPTNINRIEVCIGGWGNTSYTNIKNIIASQGTGSSSILYRNFQALKNAIPAIDAVNNDDEYTYDVNSSAAFHIMMSDLGYKTTLAPYMNKTFWQNLATNINSSRSGAVDRILLQCYDGGAGNNPADWHINNIPLHAGRMNYEDFSTSLSLMQSWKNNAGVVGGFFWVYNDETWSLNTYATAVNRIFGAKTTSAAVATFCSDINYGGYNIRLPIGSFTIADLAAYGITNDDISSFKVNSGYKVTVYNDNNFSGTSTSYTSDQSNVGSTYNDQISSIKIYKSTTAPAATFYPDVNYGGFPAALPLGTFTADELAAYGIKNDDITSLKVNSGYRVVLYTDNNFSGTSVTYISDQSWIGDYNDKISSIQIYKYSSSPEATFYHDVNYGGSSVGLPQGTFTAEEMAAYGIKNDDITSLKINSGYRVVLYTDNNFSGTSINYTSDQSWIGDFNDKISSIQIYKYSSSPVSTFYSDVNYGGSSIGLPLGTYTTADLASYGIKNDDITSLKVNSGYKVIAYMDNNFGGSSVSYTSDQSNVGTTYNDEISSIQIYRYSANGAATCYSDINYGGFAAGLPLGTYTTSELVEYGIQNDDITSIKVNSGYKVIAYMDNNFTGTSVSYTSDQSNVSTTYNDKISSIQIYRYSTDAVATFYADANYAGFAAGLPLGTYTLSQLQEYGITDNSITSLKVNSGYKVIAYVDVNFSEASILFTSDQSNIGSTYNDRISSIQIYKYSTDAVASFYNSDNSQGTSTGLPTGLFTTAEMNKYGIADNSITSFDLQSGYQVTLYADDNFSGTSASYTAGQGWLYDMNDQTSSIKIYPVFGSDITDNGGTVTASHSAVSSSETIDKLTDNNALTKYCANVSAGTTVWMQYQSAASVTLQSYSLTSANDSQSRDPKAWTLQASNNGTDWTVIDTQTNQIFATRYLKKTFTVNTSNAYTYFRLVVTERYDSSATIFQLSEFQLFGSSTLMGIKTNNTTFNEATTTEIVESNLYELKIYPNPAINFINVNMPSGKLTLKYAVYNTIGVCVQTGELNNGDKVNVQSLTSGIYQLVLTDNDRRVVHQFLKTR